MSIEEKISNYSLTYVLKPVFDQQYLIPLQKKNNELKIIPSKGAVFLLRTVSVFWTHQTLFIQQDW